MHKPQLVLMDFGEATAIFYVENAWKKAINVGKRTANVITIAA